MDDLDLFKRLGMALAIGLLLGAERGWQMRLAPEGSRIAGIRSFALIGILGGAWALLAQEVGELAMAVAFAAFAALVIAAHLMHLRRFPDEQGITTEIAALLTFCLGALSVRGHQMPAAAVAVVAVTLLSLKETLHHLVERIEAAELKAATKLLLISVVVLPVLPNQGFGPGEILNPYRLWLIVVLIAGISFVGYLAMKLAGAPCRHPADRPVRRHVFVHRADGRLEPSGPRSHRTRKTRWPPGSRLPPASCSCGFW